MDSDISIRFEDRHLAQAAPDIEPEGQEYIGRMRDFGGVIKRYTARRELLFSLFDMAVVPGSASEAKSGPCLVVATVLDGVGESRFHTIGNRRSDLSFSYKPGMTYLFFSTQAVAGAYTTDVAGRFRGMEVRIGLEALKRLGGFEVFENATALSHPLVIGKDGDAWIGAFPTPDPIRQTAIQLLENDGRNLEDLVLEARGLDLLTTAIEAVRSPLFCNGVTRIRSARQLKEARVMLLADLAKPWTVPEIAKRVGLTEKRLNQESRSYYGQPVYGFLQRSRLEHAKILLESGNDSVIDVALSVGYANPSHFAKLFRRQFGVQPSKLARDRFAVGTGLMEKPASLPDGRGRLP